MWYCDEVRDGVGLERWRMELRKGRKWRTTVSGEKDVITYLSLKHISFCYALIVIIVVMHGVCNSDGSIKG